MALYHKGKFSSTSHKGFNLNSKPWGCSHSDAKRIKACINAWQSFSTNKG